MRTISEQPDNGADKPTAQSRAGNPSALAKNAAFNLDDALARILRAVRANGNEADMDALGQLLTYMETLERELNTEKTYEPIRTLQPFTLTL